MNKKDVIVVNDIKKDLSINAEDISRLTDHLALVKRVVSEVLVNDINGDYAEVPGTRKKALLKPGAEKLMRIFGLGVRFKILDSQFDRYENFAMYSYDAEVFHLKTGTVIANCEGTCNSQEKKYKERSIYKTVGGKKVYQGAEAIPVSDIVNTLKKMAQKRAMVGAVIIATGASDYFTQDEEEIEAQESIKNEVKANEDRFSKEKVDHSNYVIPVGKFKDKKLSEVDKAELTGYLSYITANNQNIDGKLKEFVDITREYIR